MAPEARAAGPRPRPAGPPRSPRAPWSEGGRGVPSGPMWRARDRLQMRGPRPRLVMPESSRDLRVHPNSSCQSCCQAVAGLSAARHRRGEAMPPRGTAKVADLTPVVVGPARAGPGGPGPGRAGPRGSRPRGAGPGGARPRGSGPRRAGPRGAGPGGPRPRGARPRGAGPRRAVEDPAVPGGGSRFGRGQGRCVHCVAEDVLLAGERVAVGVDDVRRATRRLEAAGAVRGRPRLRDRSASAR